MVKGDFQSHTEALPALPDCDVVAVEFGEQVVAKWLSTGCDPQCLFQACLAAAHVLAERLDFSPDVALFFREYADNVEAAARCAAATADAAEAAVEHAVAGPPGAKHKAERR